MKHLITVVLFCFLALIIKAQEQQNSDKTEYKKLYKHSIGVGAGSTTGFGISYRYFPKKLGFQVNFVPFYEDYGSEALISAGLTLLYNLKETKYSALYAYFGNHYLHNSYGGNLNIFTPLTQNYYYRKSNNDSEFYNSGVGVGIEFSTKKQVTLNIMGGYAQYNSLERLFFTLDAALYYRFN